MVSQDALIRLLTAKGLFAKVEFLAMVRMVDGRERGGSDCDSAQTLPSLFIPVKCFLLWGVIGLLGRRVPRCFVTSYPTLVISYVLVLPRLPIAYPFWSPLRLEKRAFRRFLETERNHFVPVPWVLRVKWGYRGCLLRPTTSFSVKITGNLLWSSGNRLWEHRDFSRTFPSR